MVAPGSRFIGTTLAELDFHWHYNAIALAIHRRGVVLRDKLKNTHLTVGDILLLVTTPEEMRALRGNKNLVVLTEREEAQTNQRKAWTSVAIMVSVVGAAVLGWLPIVASAILGCIALVATRCLDPEEVYDAIDWRVIVLLAGVLPLGIAMQKSGAADLISGYTMGLVGGYGPVAALAAIYLLTAALTEAMSNNATAVLMVPIAAATAATLGVSPTPFLIAVAFAASTSFATPVGYQTNTMVYNVGGYRFTDFLKIGLPLNIIFWIMAMIFIPIFWSF
jgi:di/tricarboxylate transporter